PAVWHAGTVTTLPLPPGVTRAADLVINNSGWIAGVVFLASGTEATLWRGSEIVDLGVLGRTRAISNTGVVVGDTRSGYAFKWDNGVLTTFEPNSAALSVNDRGDVVGTVYAPGVPGVEI